MTQVDMINNTRDPEDTEIDKLDLSIQSRDAMRVVRDILPITRTLPGKLYGGLAKMDRDHLVNVLKDGTG
ncbi:hypothetical protein SARC_02243 [Sphaeroforma arctica JP610]|uniref:Uncharacterized protein n=1 Tax=Sphaeroforma arctica JP610 TaxID=667725 RepID=A0A0L0G9P5_9EUKA|nr:hypothetical protein SARC_02243 [Sphaeroforma arctica JP610]KNC85586.1 hypothetical protein SARC_02243 [Sphaeroforma arctica JP610]|eukprot:XP_014159488.1 hypothetical protein SARC_02243 [Sphaeroforma arctica JP610]